MTYLVDYTVRNICTGDEEDIRVLELNGNEYADFPELVREKISALIAEVDYPENSNWPRWAINQDLILDLLLPFISERMLYDTNYEAWESLVLGDNE